MFQPPLEIRMTLLMRLLATLLPVVSLAGALGGQSLSSTATSASAPPPSASRAPAVSAEVARLRSELEEVIRSAGWREATHGVVVVSLDRGDTLFSLNPDLPLSPASNMKLYSTAAALYYLGPDFRFSTYLLGDGPVRDGVLEGDLILYGTGDPAISGRLLESSRSAFRAMADSLAAMGVREVRGDLVGDGSYFDSAWVGAGWEDDDRMAWYAAPVGALSFAENMVSVRVLPGAPGEAARIRTAPETEGLALSNQVRTVSSGATRIRFEHGPEGVVVSGQIRRGHPGVARSLPVVDPGNFAAAALRATLEEKGIRVAGRVRTVTRPGSSRVSLASASPASDDAPRVLAIHLSPPLSEIAEVTNHVSHNLFAEALLKTVGRVVFGEGTFEAGARAVQYFLECETSVHPEAVQVVDGSGLSRGNRASARATVHLLDYMTRSGSGEVYLSSLPEAGSARGLRRMHQTAAAGNLRAKTGTIQHVSSLSGYVDSADGERLAFSIIANGVPSTWRAKRIEDAIGARIARFQRPQLVGAPAVVAEEPEPTEAAEAVVTTVPEPAAPAAPPAARQSEPEPAAEPRTHRVRSGETLDGIARRYDTTVRELQSANPGLQPRRLQIGQRIRIPR